MAQYIETRIVNSDDKIQYMSVKQGEKHFQQLSTAINLIKYNPNKCGSDKSEIIYNSYSCCIADKLVAICQSKQIQGDEILGMQYIHL